MREVHSIDSIHMSKMLFGKTCGTGHSLDHLVSRLRIDQQGIRRHDARGDVEILGRGGGDVAAASTGPRVQRGAEVWCFLAFKSLMSS